MIDQVDYVQVGFQPKFYDSSLNFIGGEGFGIEGVIAYFDDSIRHGGLLK